MAMTVAHDLMANAIRFLAVDAVEKAKSGHPGLPMGAADVATVLFRDVLKYDVADPHWPDRDRFVLSAGHGSMMLYALIYLTGMGGDKGLTIDDLEHFRQVGSKTPGHPEYGHTIGVETTTGPLGQGIASAVGMAIAERMMAAQFANVVDHRTYVIASDGDLMEGVSQEAIAIAGHLRLSKLIVFYDDNGISIDGHTSLSDSVDQVVRFKSAGWNASHIDGHDVDAIRKAIHDAQASDRPTMIACKTTIGFGSPNREGTQKAHSDAFGPDEVAATRKNLELAVSPVRDPQRDSVGMAGRGRARRFRAGGLDEEARGAGSCAAERVRAAGQRQAAQGPRQRHRRLQASARRAGAGNRHTQGGRSRPQRDRPGRARTRDRLGRPHAVEQHQGRRDKGDHAGGLLRTLHPLGHPRARHGCGL